MRRDVLPRLGAALVLSALACAEPTAVLDSPGRYALVSVNGMPLPAQIETSLTEYGIIIADTIALDGRGRASRTFVLRRVSTTTGRDDLYRPRRDTEYRLGPEDRISIGFFTPCPANALCVQNDEGRALPFGLELTTRQYAYGAQLVFERIADAP